MGDLVLATFTIDKGLIHSVLVVERGHFHGSRTVVVPKKLIHLAFARDGGLLELNLVLVVNELAFLPVFLKSRTLGALKLVGLPLLHRLERVILVEPTVAEGGFAARKNDAPLFCVLAHRSIFLLQRLRL